MFKMMDRVSALIFWLFIGLMGLVTVLELGWFLPGYAHKAISSYEQDLVWVAERVTGRFSELSWEQDDFVLPAGMDSDLENLQLGWGLIGAELFRFDGELLHRFPAEFHVPKGHLKSGAVDFQHLNRLKTAQVLDEDLLDIFDHKVLIFLVPVLNGAQIKGVFVFYKDVESTLYAGRSLVFKVAMLPLVIILVMVMIVSVFMTALDESIVVQEQAALELGENRRCLATLISNIPGMVYRCLNDPDWTMVMVSEGGCTLMGRPCEDLLNNRVISFAALIYFEDRDRVWREVQGSIEAKTPFELEYRIVHADGSLRWCWEQGCGIFDDSGTLEAIEGLIVDITDRKLISEQLDEALEKAIDLTIEMQDKNIEIEKQHQEIEKAYAELKATQGQILQQEKMASIGQLAAGVAHEINNPMGFISSNLNSLGKYLKRFAEYVESQDLILRSLQNQENEVGLDEIRKLKKSVKLDYLLSDGKDLIEESLEGAERVRSIVQGLKNFSRIDQAEFQDADINECLESTIRIAWNEIKYKARLNKDLGELPKTFCYPQQLNQVFLNILVNAAHAIEKEGVIDVKTWAVRDEIFISISDDGCGIPEANLARLFEPFFSTKEVGKGTGLGLSISYDIMKKHDGRIEVRSRLGEGTTFVLRLPVRSDSGGLSTSTETVA